MAHPRPAAPDRRRGRRPRRAPVVVVVAALAALASGCGGSGDGTAATTTTTKASVSTTSGGGSGATATTAPGESSPGKGSSGCGTPPDPTPKETKLGDGTGASITYQGVERGFRLGVPVGYDPDTPTPLVFNLHGLGSNAIEQTVYSGIPKAATGRGWIAVTPESHGGPWKLGKDGDVGYLGAVLTSLEDRYCIDTTRVYSAGMSMGALMSAQVACGIPGTFAAIGLVAVEFKPATCDPIPLVVFHGTEDPVVPYKAGGTVRAGGFTGVKVQGTAATMATWAESNGCDPGPAEAPIGSDVVRSTWKGCTPPADTVLYTVEGGGHSWPGSAIKLPYGKTTDTVDATELILDFFARHQLPS